MPTDFTRKKKRDAQWRLDNKERVREHARKYREANADRIRQSRREYSARPEVIARRRKWQAEYRERNRERLNAKQREWYTNNAEHAKEYARQRRDKERGGPPHHCIEQDRRPLASRAKRVAGYYEIETRDRDGVFTVLVSRKDYPLLRQWTSIRRFNSSKHCPRATQENWVVQLCRFVNGKLESAYLGRLILNVTDRNLCVVRRDASSLDYRRRNLKVMTRKQLAAMRRGFTKKEVA